MFPSLHSAIIIFLCYIVIEHPDSGLSKVVLTVVFILTVVSSLSGCSQQHSPHFYFHVFSSVLILLYE